jgi:hypothetical protein
MKFELSGDATRKSIIFGLTLFLAVPFGFYYGRLYWDNGIAGATVGVVLGTIPTAIGLIIIGKIAGLFGLLVGERKASFSKREQLETNIQQVRYHRMRKEYNTALQKVNEILSKDSEFPEAIFLKAQIVWEGFNNSVVAISNLEKLVMIVNDKQSTIFRWANSLMREIKNSCNDPKN